MKTAVAKLFQHGGSQALRLPKDFRLPGSVVRLSMTPEGILVQPLEDNQRRARLFARLEGSCPEFPEIESPPDDEPREPLVRSGCPTRTYSPFICEAATRACRRN